MKRVFQSNSECIHIFAQRTHEEGRTPNSNVYFYGDKLYSYGRHYLLAEFKNDGQYVIINDSGYSVSTSKHIGIAFGATSHYKQFRKTSIDLGLVYNEVMTAKKKLANARKPEMYISQIIGCLAGLNEYIEFIGVKKMTRDKRYKEIARLVAALNEDSEGIQARLKDHAKKEKTKKARKDAKKLKIVLAEFNSYERRTFRIGDKDFLRLSQCGEFVETSQGVRIKVENARVLYAMIEAGRDIKGVRIEHYTVTSINGTLKIGCHNINIDSVHKVGKLIK